VSGLSHVDALGRPSDINNPGGFVGDSGTESTSSWFGTKSYIADLFNISEPKWFTPIANATGITFEAINDNGDVVGACDDDGTNARGIFYSGSGSLVDVGPCQLFDINNNRLAVGVDNDGNAISVNLQSTTDPPSFSLARLTLPEPYTTAVARAVNASGTIVGYLGNDEKAFVSYPDGTTLDLNEVLEFTGYTLLDAFDINDSGQIVGTAVSPDGLWAYIATPKASPRMGGLTLGDWATIFGESLGVDAGGFTPYGPIPPWGPEQWNALSVEQQDSLTRFTIAQLSRALTSFEMRAQINLALLLPNSTLGPLQESARDDRQVAEIQSKILDARRRILRLR
jgi:hypothetical protein